MSARSRTAPGFALVGVLGLLALLTMTAALAWQLEALERRQLLLSRGEARAVLALETATARLLPALSADAGRGGADHPQEDWARPVALALADGAHLSCRVHDLTARLNVNTLLDERGVLSPERRAAFTHLLAAAGLPASAVDALADRLDRDDDPRLPWGAESAWYRDHRPGLPHRDGPMHDLHELASIRGFPPDAAARLGLWLTALPDGAPLNVNSASPELLARLDPAFTPGRLAALEAARPFVDLVTWRSWAAGTGLPILAGLLAVTSHFRSVDCLYEGRDARLGEAVAVSLHPDGRLDFLGRTRLAPKVLP